MANFDQGDTSARGEGHVAIEKNKQIDKQTDSSDSGLDSDINSSTIADKAFDSLINAVKSCDLNEENSNVSIKKKIKVIHKSSRNGDKHSKTVDERKESSSLKSSANSAKEKEKESCRIKIGDEKNEVDDNKKPIKMTFRVKIEKHKTLELSEKSKSQNKSENRNVDGLASKFSSLKIYSNKENDNKTSQKKQFIDDLCKRQTESKTEKAKENSERRKVNGSSKKETIIIERGPTKDYHFRNNYSPYTNQIHRNSFSGGKVLLGSSPEINDTIFPQSTPRTFDKIDEIDKLLQSEVNEDAPIDHSLIRDTEKFNEGLDIINELIREDNKNTNKQTNVNSNESIDSHTNVYSSNTVQNVDSYNCNVSKFVFGEIDASYMSPDYSKNEETYSPSSDYGNNPSIPITVPLSNCSPDYSPISTLFSPSFDRIDNFENKSPCVSDFGESLNSPMYNVTDVNPLNDEVNGPSSVHSDPSGMYSSLFVPHTSAYSPVSDSVIEYHVENLRSNSQPTVVQSVQDQSTVKFRSIGCKKPYLCCTDFKNEGRQTLEDLSKFVDTSDKKKIHISIHTLSENDLIDSFDNQLSTWNNNAEFNNYHVLLQIHRFYTTCERLLMRSNTMTKFFDIYSNGHTLLDRAILNCSQNPMVVKYLGECIMRASGDGNITISRDGAGNTLIHRRIIQQCMNQNTSCANSLSALFSLTRFNKRVLEVDLYNDDGMAPLHVACTTHVRVPLEYDCSCVRIVHVLLEHGQADANIKERKSGNTPLHLAIGATLCAPSLISTLLKYGAKRSIENYSLCTPLDLAKSIFRSKKSEIMKKVVDLLE